LYTLIKTFKVTELKAVHYVMNKGLYSKKNIDEIYDNIDGPEEYQMRKEWIRRKKVEGFN